MEPLACRTKKYVEFKKHLTNTCITLEYFQHKQANHLIS